ncbi:2-amino-4-hydroxy-6-hydroxymethyldihydropteridinediphosphokinase [Thioclava dalianensis]|nr:2-amino-4-hydroxy-6-hydroxymethyldihydropteridinediphosphokinase [Thioclava dalianensis]
MDNSLLCAMGANLSRGPDGPEAAVSEALILLKLRHFKLKAISRFWRTPAFPEGSGPDFVNACCILQTNLTPNATLEAFHEVEAELGRARTHRWGARVVDIDLLAYEDRVLPSRQEFAHWRDLSLPDQMLHTPERLILPHPRLQDRGFVLIPLVEIAPLWRHPVSGRSVREMCEALPEADKAQIHPI